MRRVEAIDSTGEVPESLLEVRVAIAFARVDAERSAWLTQKCREAFARERATVLESNAKQLATRARNKALREALKTNHEGRA